MDNTWKMRIGIPTARPHPLNSIAPHKVPEHSSRRFGERGSSFHRREREDSSVDIVDDHLRPEYFTDVFGGPPRSVLSGQFGSTGIPVSSSSSCFFYDEIFRCQNSIFPSMEMIGRSLKEFRIPTKRVNGFYSDIFGCDDDHWVMRSSSRSRSKTSSSSVFSSEEVSPPRATTTAAANNVSIFASKLRWDSTWRKDRDDHLHSQHDVPASAVGTQPMFKDGFENFSSSSFGFSERNTSPETKSCIDLMSNRSFRVSAQDLDLKSPPSGFSSVCRYDRNKKTIYADDATEQEEEEIMGSYVIEINSCKREGVSEHNGIDEAIAWAKEKFQSHCPDQKSQVEKHTEESLSGNQLSEVQADSFGSLDEKHDKWGAEEEIKPFQSKMQIEMQEMDEKILLWSKGKESDIRLLLSSLHHILWPNSGWYMIPLRNMIESSQVKKAYQKARLCLHPDKLQQRGATFPQKYIAEKAFSILQDAWASFISQDIFRR